MAPERRTIEVECRASELGPILHGCILQEGRAATGGRAEVFAPGSAVWPSDGIALRLEHLGAAELRAVPTREPNGEIRIAVPATPAILEVVEQRGRRFLSVEFEAESETTTRGGVREIRRALVSAAALTDRPEYEQAAAEVRTAVDRVPVWL